MGVAVREGSQYNMWEEISDYLGKEHGGIGSTDSLTSKWSTFGHEVQI